MNTTIVSKKEDSESEISESENDSIIFQDKIEIENISEFSENDNLEISSLHALFDNYLPPNLGNYPQRTLEFFKNVLLKNQNLYDEELLILENSLIYNERIPNFEEEKIYYEIGYEYENYEDYDDDDDDDESNGPHFMESINLKDIGKKDFINTYFTVRKFYSLFYRGKKYDSLFSFLLNLSKYIFQNFELKYDKLIITSGWKLIIGGHLISLYYEKIYGNLYKLIIFNSGDGLQNHYRYDDKFYNISMYRKATTTELIEILKFFKLLKYVEFEEYNNYFDDGYSVSDIYYLFINEFKFKNNSTVHGNNSRVHSKKKSTVHGKKKSTVDGNVALENICKQLPQLSGSCTYFGFFYNLLYILQKNKKNLDDFKNEVIIYAQEDIINYLEKKEFITDFDKNYIDLINIEKLDKYNNIYLEYKYNLENNFFSFYTSEEKIKFKKNKNNFIYEYNNIYELIKKLSKMIEKKGNYWHILEMFIITQLRYILDKDNNFFNLDILNFEKFIDYLKDLEWIFLYDINRIEEASNYLIIFKLICVKVIENNKYLEDLLIYDNLKLKNDNFNHNLADLHFKSMFYIEPLKEEYFDLYKKYFHLINFDSFVNDDYISRIIKKTNDFDDYDNIYIYKINIEGFYNLFNELDFNNQNNTIKNSLVNFVLILSNTKIISKVRNIYFDSSKKKKKLKLNINAMIDKIYFI